MDRWPALREFVLERSRASRGHKDRDYYSEPRHWNAERRGGQYTENYMAIANVGWSDRSPTKIWTFVSVYLKHFLPTSSFIIKIVEGNNSSALGEHNTHQIHIFFKATGYISEMNINFLLDSFMQCKIM